jgi:CRISPR type III-B/RAMP module-associated protein Cmr5
MTRLDIDQERAKYAYKCVIKAKSEGNYGSHIARLPMMIHNSGLRNTLAFAYMNGYLKAKNDNDKKDWKLVCKHLFEWLFIKETSQTLVESFNEDFKTKSDKFKMDIFMSRIIELKDYEYRFATQESLALVNWLRKLVKGD